MILEIVLGRMIRARYEGMFQARFLRLALDAGEPRRLCKALAYQCVIDAQSNDPRNIDGDLKRARTIAATLQDPQIDASIDLAEGTVHWMERRWPPAAQLLSGLTDNLAQISGGSWIRHTAQDLYGLVLIMLGRYAEFRERVDEFFGVS